MTILGEPLEFGAQMRRVSEPSAILGLKQKL